MMEKRFKLHIVPHTHWDREWYYTLEEFRYRLVKLLDTLLTCMENDSITYFVLDGQTIALEDYFAIRPENRDRIRALTQSGRLIIGPWYTQPNVFMSGAEAQVRNLFRGRVDMAAYGGSQPHINYLPDQFGYNSQMPQLMQGFGMRYLVGARGMPKGCDTFLRWIGSDGTAVKVCALPHSYISACAISDRELPRDFNVFGCTISMPSLPERMAVILSERSRSIAPHLLGMNGVDHMFPNTSMLSTLQKIKELYPDLDVAQSNFSLYIDDVEASLEQELSEYSGELRDPRENLILPASQSMRMDVKKYNVRMEDLFVRGIEPMLCRLCSIGERDLPISEFNRAWEILLENHAHDSLCCSNAEASYREVMVRFDKISDIGREIKNELDQRLLRRIIGLPQEALMVANPSPFDREEPLNVEVIVSSSRDFAEPHLFYDGAELPACINGVKSDSLLRFVPFSGFVGQLEVNRFNMTIAPGLIPATGYKLLEVRGGPVHDRPVDGLIRGLRRMENAYLVVNINPDATVTVTDKRTGRVYSELNSFIDNGDAGNGFQHVPPCRDELAVSCGRDMAVSITENNPMKGAITISQTVTVPAGLSADRQARSGTKADIRIASTVILRAGCPYVEFETCIDNTATDHRLRVAFPTDIDSDNGFAGQPFDVVRRPVQPDYVNHFEADDNEAFVGYHPMQDFCGISDGKLGATVAGDGLMEYEILPMRRTLCLTLIRAVDRILVGAMATGSKFQLPAAQLQGEQHYRYAFIPHAGDYDQALQAVEAFRHPLTATQKDFLEAESMPDYIAPTPVLPKTSSFIRVDGACVMTSIKPAQTGSKTVLRLFNPLDSQEALCVEVDNHYKLLSAQQTRIDETPIGSIDVADNRIRLTAGPRQIITLMLNIQLKG